MASPSRAFPLFPPEFFANQRIEERRFLRMAAWMIFYRHGLRKHVSLVRDVNRKGIYFYSNFAPAVGTEIEFVMKFPAWTNLGPVACKGEVLRVEQPVDGAAMGIAVKLSRFWVLPDVFGSARRLR